MNKIDEWRAALRNYGQRQRLQGMWKERRVICLVRKPGIRYLLKVPALRPHTALIYAANAHISNSTHTHTHTETHMEEGTYIHLTMDSYASENENWLKHSTTDSVEEKEYKQWWNMANRFYHLSIWTNAWILAFRRFLSPQLGVWDHLLSPYLFICLFMSLFPNRSYTP